MSSRVIRFLCRISFLLGACLAFAIATFAQAGNEPWKAQGIINTSASLKAKLHSVPIRAVTMGDGFWSERMRTNAEKSIPTLLGLLEEHGVVDNFRRLSGRKNAGRRGRFTPTPISTSGWKRSHSFCNRVTGRSFAKRLISSLTMC